jgi:hypothetical protein
MTHPYKSAPDSAFWSRAVAANWNPHQLVDAPLLRKDDRVASAGSCFASSLVPYLERAGLTYVRCEARHPLFSKFHEPFGYDNFSAAYGNIYTARQMLQLIQRCAGTFQPHENRWITPNSIIDPFRPGLKYEIAESEQEFERLRAQHLNRVLDVISTATVFIFTLGLTEAWQSKDDGAVFPACPGTIAGTFDPDRHGFRNFTVSEIAADLREMIRAARLINPSLRFILTVSPVPLVATATSNHVLTATIYSKSVLRVAAGDVADTEPAVSYFPSYEIVTGPQAPHSFFEPDRRSVSRKAIDAVMDVFLSHCEVGAAANPKPTISIATLSAALSEAECEEAMTER